MRLGRLECLLKCQPVVFCLHCIMTELVQTSQTLSLKSFTFPRLLIFIWLGRVLSVFIALIVPALLVLLWQIAASHGWVSPQILPAPVVVYQSFTDLLASGELQEHLLGSLGRVGIAFGIAGIFGIALGTLLGISRAAEAYIAPLFKGYAQTPVIAWIPIGLLLFGITEKLAVALITIAAVVPVVLNTYKGVRYIPPAYFELARIYHFTRMQTLTRIIAPAALPSIIEGLRYGLTQAWLTLVAAELVGIDRGIGALIVEARNLFQLDIVLVAILVLAIVGFALDRAFSMIEKRLLHWRQTGV